MGGVMKDGVTAMGVQHGPERRWRHDGDIRSTGELVSEQDVAACSIRRNSKPEAAKRLVECDDPCSQCLLVRHTGNGREALFAVGKVKACSNLPEFRCAGVRCMRLCGGVVRTSHDLQRKCP